MTGILTRAALEVPPDLKQHLTLIPDSLSYIDDSAFQQRNTDVRVRHLFKTNGQFTHYQALFTANELLIRDTVLGQVIGQHLFEDGVSIKEVLYLPAQDGTFGVVVACNMESDGFLLRLLRSPNLDVVYKLAVPNKITSARVIFSDADERPAMLCRRMTEWSNILAIGTQCGHGYIVNVPVDEQWTEETPMVEKPLTDALRSFQKGGIFSYRDPRAPDFRKPIEDVHVSAIGFIARSCVILMGLSFGGIIQICITDSGEITQIALATTSPIRHIIALLPHDDPNMHVWFCVLAGAMEKGLRLVLFEGMYDVKGQENVPVLERQYRNPQFWVKCVESFPKGSRWITAQPLARERRYGNRDDAEETMNNVTLNDTDLDYSQMFYAFVGPDGELMCGLFDLNTYYFKRLLEHPRPDSTIAKQCPFLSLAYGPEQLPVPAKTITDISVDCESLRKFRFAEDPEQLLYISSMDLLKIHVGTTSATFELELKSLPSQVLDRICRDLRTHAKNPREAVRKLIAVGLMTSMSSQELQTEFAILMSAVLVYGKLPALMTIVRQCTETDIPFLKKTSDWLWGEVNRARKTLDSINELLFSVMKGMSTDQKKQMAQVHRVTNASKKIFARIHHIFDILQKKGALSPFVSGEVQVRLAACCNLSDYVNCINNLCQHHYLPMGDCSSERKELEDAVSARRQARSSGDNPRPLFIDKVVQKMYDCAPEDDMWLEQSAAEWYPPVLHNAVSVLLPYTIPDKLKADFMIYFICDHTVARKFIGFGKGRSAYDRVLLSAVDVLSGVLKLDRERVSQVFEIWYKETEPVPLEATLPVLQLDPGMEDANSKINTIVANKDFLNDEQENELKSLCDSVPFGKYRWQLYLLDRGRFPEVEILDVAPAFSNEYERLYSQALPGIRRLKQNSRPWNERNSTAPDLAGDVLGRIKTFDPSAQDDVPARTKFNPKTPVALFKRVRRVPEKTTTTEKRVHEDDVTKSPDLKRRRLTTDDTTSPHTPTVPSSLDPHQKQVMASILRTPTSRRARAAAALEHQTGICVTPENEPVVPQPTSILRTPIRKMMSPSRGRLRWDPEFVEESLDSTDIAATMAQKDAEEDEEMEEDANETLEVEGDGMGEDEESVEVMEDESKEESYEEQEEEEEEKEVEEQEEDSSEEPEEKEIEKEVEEMQDEVLEKEIEEQEEVEKVVEEQQEEEVEQGTEEQEEEVEKSIEQQEENGEATVGATFNDSEQIYATMKLVDYSLTDSTIMETPPRGSERDRCATWTTDDGIHHSFEQQPDEKSEKGTPAKVPQVEEPEKSFEQQMEETEASEVVEKSFERQNSEDEPPVEEETPEVPKEAEKTKAPEEVEKSFERQEEEQVAAPVEATVAVEEPEAATPVAVESPVPPVVEEEEKSPSRRGRQRKEASEEPAPKEKSAEPAARRSSRGRSLSTTSSKQPVKVEATFHLDVTASTSIRRSSSRTRTPSVTDKSTAHRALFTVNAEKSKDVEMEEIAKEEPKAAATPAKRGRTPRTTAATPPRVTRAASAQPAVEEKKLDPVAKFLANVAKGREKMGGTRTTTRKRTTSESAAAVPPKKPANVPDTINEEEEVVAKPRARASSRSRTASRSVAEKEPSPAPARTTRSPARGKKEPTPDVAPTRKSTRSPSRSRKIEAEAPVAAATLEVQAPVRRTPSRAKKVFEKEATPEPPAPSTSKTRGKSPARAAKEPVVEEKVKRSAGRPRKAASVAPAPTAVLELVPPRRASSRTTEVTQSATPGRRGKT